MNNTSNYRTLLICALGSLFITIFNLFNFDSYISIVNIPFLILLISSIYLIKKNSLEINKKAYLLLIPIILILISNIIIKIDDSNMILNVVILPILITMFFFMLTCKNYQIPFKFIGNVFRLFPSGLFNNLKYIKFEHKTNKTKIFNVIKGLIIAVPIAFILLTLLTDADSYFSAFIDKISDFLFYNIDINYAIYKIILPFIIFFIFLFVIFINIIKNKDNEYEKSEISNINVTISSTILIVINLVYVLFIISEISRITNNFLELPIQYTYAEYAREGFFQLLIVTSINFGILLYYIYKTNSIKENKFIKNMLILLISFSILLILNSYYRMFLYINKYSFTVLRLQVVIFLTMELLLFVLLIKKIIFNLKHKESIMFTIIIIVTYIINLYLCNQTFLDLFK